MKQLTKQELLKVEGGYDLETLFFASGFMAGRAFDFAIGIIDGFVQE